MNAFKKMIANTALLTGAALFMRFSGMLWQVWLAGRIGEAGIGLFQLVLSVSGLAATIAVSGIRFTATRLISEELGIKHTDGVRAALRHCWLYAAVFGVVSTLALLLLSQRIAFLWLGDARTAAPLRWMAIALPCLSFGAVINGYFTACGRVWKSVCVQIIREVLMIGLTVCLLRSYRRGDLESACRCIAMGGSIADWVGLLILFLLFRADKKRYTAKSSVSKPLYNMSERLVSLALPLAVASYARSALSTLQHLLVPKGLKKAGLSAELALAGYGVIQGMSLPVVLFPSCLMLALAEMIVPQLTEAQVQKNCEKIADITEIVLDRSFVFCVYIAALLFALGKAFGLILYDSAEAGRYICIFAWIVPIMYMDMITDGCLKGLGEMMFCMKVNIADAGISALLVWLLLPYGGLSAYISIICFTECFNFFLSLWRLKKVSDFTICSQRLLCYLLSAAISGMTAWSVYQKISTGMNIPALILSVVFSVLIYAALIYGIRPEEAAGRQASGRHSLRC